MNVKVLFFGRVRDLVGIGQEQVELADGVTVDEFWQEYEQRFPRLKEASRTILVAVNQEIVERCRRLRHGDEVAFMPPVSGGASDDVYRITREPVLAHELAAQLKAPQDGAVVIFEGVVRDNSRGHKTLLLEYEAYEPMAVRQMEEIGRELKQRYAVERVGIVHRVGRLEIGEVSVAIVVTSPHRQAAFEACHYAIDRLKQIVPIWKKEYFEDGAVWVEGEERSSFQPSAFSDQPKVSG